VLPQAQTQLDLRGGPEEDGKKGREQKKGTERMGKIEVRVENGKEKDGKFRPTTVFKVGTDGTYDLLNVKVKALCKCYFVWIV